ncbi:hypothetical protein HDU98_000893 [Podochytrium sp. JEL0797]|nr:hypothetical protein HDU98_000893 [Podochytrium sp. JEL0797]
MMDLLDEQDPERSTPTADFMMDVFSNNRTSSSSAAASLEYQNLKTPTSQTGAFSIMTNQIGGMVGAMNPNTFSVAVESDPNFAMAHLLDRNGVDALVKARHQYPPREAYTRLPHDHLSTHYKLLHRLGRGSFADVFKVQLLPTTHPHTPLASTTSSAPPSTLYAIKKTRVAITGSKDRKFQIQELILQYHLSSLPHVVHLHTAWEQYASLYLVMEFCAGGTLAQYIERNRGGGGVEEFVIWAVLGQLARALQQMHERGVVHLDLKPGNVLIAGEGGGVLKVGDFGCASFLPVPEGFEKEGDRRYMAPEILVGRYGPECDVFSLGLIIFELATTLPLPDNGSQWQSLRRHDFSQYHGHLNRVSPPLVELIQGMLHPVPERRIGVERVLEHTFVQAILEGGDVGGGGGGGMFI